MVILKIIWQDSPYDESDYDRGVKEETYEETYTCSNYKEAAQKLSALDGSQYNGHEIINWTMIGQDYL